MPRYSGTSSRVTGKVTPLTETWRIDQSTAVESEEDGAAMVAFDACAVLVRGLPQSGPRDKDHHQLLRRDFSAVGGLGQQGLTLTTNRQNPLVVDDHEFPKVFWVLLDFGSMPSPIEVFGHAQLTVGHHRRLHGAPL